jgi:hypothetical protein
MIRHTEPLALHELIPDGEAEYALTDAGLELDELRIGKLVLTRAQVVLAIGERELARHEASVTDRFPAPDMIDRRPRAGWHDV